MSEADRIWAELDITFSRWGLREIPFTESASTLSLAQLREVFTGRDDLDKQDPAHARQLLHNAQGMLKGRAWFVLTGHPAGLTRDILISERGLYHA